jgi:hypothetical protein
MWKWKAQPNEFVRLSVKGVTVFVGYQQNRDAQGRVKTTLAISADADVVKIEETEVPAFLVAQFERSRVPQVAVAPPIQRALRPVPQVSVTPPQGGQR